MADLLQLGGKMLLDYAQPKSDELSPGFETLDHESQKPMIYDEDPTFHNTLDEPVMDTIKRDLKMIRYKLEYVLNPKARQEGAKELRDWDLWGPLILTLAFAFILSLKAKEHRDSVFGSVFVIIWGGSTVLTLNAKFLGGKISYFQSICVLGYCVFPIVIGAFAISVVEILFNLHFIINLGVCGFALFWSVVSCMGFMSQLVTEEKKLLVVYPMVLFYLSLSWMVLLAASQ